MSNGYPNSTSPLPGATSPGVFHKTSHSLKPQHSPSGPPSIVRTASALQAALSAPS